MAQDTQTTIHDESFATVRRRLLDGRWILLTFAAVLLFFVATASLSAGQAIVGFAVVSVAIAILPRNAGRRRQIASRTNLNAQVREHTAMRLVEALPHPCFLLDSRATVMHRNEAAISQFPSVMTGNPIAFSMRYPALLAAVDLVRSTGEPQRIEMNQTTPTETWFDVYVAPAGLSARTLEGHSSDWIAVTMFNLTEQKRVDAMRVDFIAHASHELRTPLTSLIGFIETLQGPAAQDAEAREKFLGIMRSQSQRMSKLIDDLLSLSRIELRKHVKPTTHVNLSLILGEVVEGLQNQAKEMGVDVNIYSPDGPIVVLGDREELYEVLENLIENAVKYGGDGKSVDVSLMPTDRPGFDYVLNVVDHGAGIPHEHVPRLTERFYRVDAENSRKKKGTGLGLAIVKHILNRHQGQMTIKSEVGVGTSVEILLKK